MMFVTMPYLRVHFLDQHFHIGCHKINPEEFNILGEHEDNHNHKR